MKTIALLLATTLLFSCKKDEVPEQRVSEPTVTSVTFYPASAGANISVGFTVNISVDAGSISKVTLYREPNKEVWNVDNPETGTYKMYDHSIDTYPTVNSNAKYYFVFTKKNGGTVSTTPFQVY